MLELVYELILLDAVLVLAAGLQMELGPSITQWLGMLHQCSARAPILQVLQC